MKRITSLLLIVSMIAMSLFFNSCNNEKKDTIVGAWEDSYGDLYFVLDEDGKWSDDKNRTGRYTFDKESKQLEIFVESVTADVNGNTEKQLYNFSDIVLDGDKFTSGDYTFKKIDVSKKKELLVGEWHWEKYGVVVTYTFKDDGTYTASTMSTGKIVINDNGPTTGTYTYEPKQRKMIRDGEESNSYVYEIDDTVYLHMNNEMTLKKVK